MDKTTPKEIVITAILVIALLEGVALIKGIDGVLFTTCIAVIAGLAGYSIPSPFIKK